MKPIETIYDHRKFRSRLESRWAVFFNTLGISYDYEPQGYIIGGVPYLPDFWLPRQRYWIEIKGQLPTIEEQTKAYYLAAESGCETYIISGPIEQPDERLGGSVAEMYCAARYCPPVHSSGVNGLDYLGARYFMWTECPVCHVVEMTVIGQLAGLTCNHVKDGYGYVTPRLVAAYNAARMAQFEHGKSGE